jgi:hypothetical protein
MDTKSEIIVPAAKTTKPARKITLPGSKAKVAAAPKADNIPATKVAKQPVVHVHRDAGLTIDYSGPSSPINAGRKVQIVLGITRAKDAVTDRMQKSLYGLRTKYGAQAFPAKGLDNGVLRDLLACGLISTAGGMKVNIDGKECLTDGTTQVTVHLTKAGMEYGKA